MSMITEEFGVIPPDIQSQMLIAPVMGEMIATQAFAIGEQFIVNSTLYKATKAIAIGDTISVGTGANDNCILSDSITQQIKKGPEYFFVHITSGTVTIAAGRTTVNMTTAINNKKPAGYTFKYLFWEGAQKIGSLTNGTVSGFVDYSEREIYIYSDSTNAGSYTVHATAVYIRDDLA